MRLGVYQCEAAGRSPEERLDRLNRHLSGAALDLVVCPELFLSGYNLPDHAALAEPPDGPFAQGIAALARAHHCAIVYGYPEAGDDGKLYNAAALRDAGGRLLANHRKRLPSPGSFEVERFARGNRPSFAQVVGWRVALLICYEVEFPETVRQAAQGGAELVLVPTALGRDWPVVAERLVPTRAFENGIYLAYADHAGAEGDATYCGGSRIAGPDGADLAVAGPGEALIQATLDRARVAALQARLPYLRDCGGV